MGKTTDARDGGPSWDRVFNDLKALTRQDYDGCDYATLVIHFKKGMPDLCHPIITSTRPIITRPPSRKGNR